MKRAVGLLVLATILWSGNYICGRFLATALPATLLNTIRWAISTAILFGILAINKKEIPIFTRWKEFLILGFFGIFAFSTLNYMGLRLISASQAGMISAGTPVAILLFTSLILEEHIKGKSWLGTIVSLIGVVLLFMGKKGDAFNGSWLGGLETLLAGCTWALYTVFGKKFGKNTDPLTMTAGAAFYGTLFSALSCIVTVQPNMIHMTASAWLAVIYVSTLASVGAFYAWNAGVKVLSASKAAPYLNLLPVFTVVLGVLVLKEQISGTSFVGGVITILGAILATL
ncbi:DMT family transporter [Desulfosporosinus metallidurans]|uniref:Permease of the drug/metabolite transporter (DMT) superfamily n=1 Tax=Desulfosporosinus metallidurans TaxID=1888891 RepID=A0A1Q8R191_9FIRM|nr:DMT family transporter [Desulfosporosinus metallidurans]OLN33379.1 Permease of the drug/metabolite transporter (DMT) superfamily [Desulfosporosinus metallidurans]